MNIVVDKLRSGWGWDNSSLTVFFRPYDVSKGEGYIWGYVIHELIEANLAKILCGGKCGNEAGCKLFIRKIAFANPFHLRGLRTEAGICHILTWLIGRW